MIPLKLLPFKRYLCRRKTKVKKEKKVKQLSTALSYTFICAVCSPSESELGNRENKEMSSLELRASSSSRDSQSNVSVVIGVVFI